MDPEQIYQEVLQEEQAKGSVTAVAEGRAKAARQRANHGSPHPKEAKWWPGSQPRWEGGEAAPAAEAETEAVGEAAEEPAEETPAEAPAAEAPAPAAEAPAAEAPAPAEPTPAAPAAEAAPQPVAAATTAPTGVTHGTPSGNRLRPEDGVATQAQFDAQQAHYERRKLIDELVNSGVPAVAAQGSGRPAAPFLAILYILIPILAIFILLANDDGGGEAAGHGGEAAEAPAEGDGLTVSAANTVFDTDTITVTAGEEAVIDFVNEDTAEHNISVYPDQEAGVAKTDALFTGDVIQGGQEITYNVPAQEAGEYFFQCDIHPNMNGAYVAE